MIGIAFVSIFEKFNWHHVGMLHADSGKHEQYLEKSKFDLLKYSLIRNNFGAHWIQRIGPIHELFN